MRFDFHLDYDCIVACGYSGPTAVQMQALPAALAGHNCVASAETGTGKTLAFLLPAMAAVQRAVRYLVTMTACLRLQMLSKARPLLPVAVILVPTRELAHGIHSMLQSLTKGTNITSALLLGGTPLEAQKLALKRGCR